jgi:4-diphosphocytidyl-2-C-methyl-D-erythritol kinase
MSAAPAETAHAKVNLHLHVTGRRADGYHLLDSLAVFPAVADRLSATPAETLSLAVEGPFAAALAGEQDNLVLRAATRLAEAHGLRTGARLVLHKVLPIASGIGGGSADAAAALRLLARLWNVPIPGGLALSLGADVPVCLAQHPARMQGVGEILVPAPRLPSFGIVLANPGRAVPTPAVFRQRAAIGAGFTPPATLPKAWPTAATMATDLAATTNDLAEAAIALCPPIADVLAALATLPGCRLARMSGSGATCFALFDTPAIAAAAAARLNQPGWWVWGGAGHEG